MGKWKNMKIESTSGAELNAYVCMPEQQPRAIVQINHGLAEHADRYARFALFLAERGFATIAHDHRGHGHTVAPGAPLGNFGPRGLPDVIDDIAAVNRHARSNLGSDKLICFGHSMGGILALNYAIRHVDSIAALSVWNASISDSPLMALFRLVLKIERWRRGSDAVSPIPEKLTFKAWNAKFAPNRTDFDWLSRDEKEVDAYVSDPFCGFPVTIGMWQAILEAVGVAADRASLRELPRDLPVHLVAGEADPSTENAGLTRKLAAKLQAEGMRDVTLQTYAQTRHESLNEVNRDEIQREYAEWLERILQKRTA